MKKILIFGSLIISVCTNGFAGTELWFSRNQTQVFSIKLEPSYTRAKVWIFVDDESYSNWKITGINIKNCGEITHVDPGGVAFCKLSIQNPTITFTADKSISEFAAFGWYIYQPWKI